MTVELVFTKLPLVKVAEFVKVPAIPMLPLLAKVISPDLLPLIVRLL